MRHSSSWSTASPASASSSQSSAPGGAIASGVRPAPPPAGLRPAARARTASRTVAEAPLPAGCERLGHEERIAGRLPKSSSGVDACGSASRQGPRHERAAGSRSRWIARPVARRAEHHPKRMGPSRARRLGSRGRRARERLDPSADQPENVERRLIRPVDVVEDEDVVAREPSSCMSADATACGLPPAWTTSASSPPASSATSRSGPSGRGVNRGSQAPQRIRAEA